MAKIKTAGGRQTNKKVIEEPSTSKTATKTRSKTKSTVPASKKQITKPATAPAPVAATPAQPKAQTKAQTKKSAKRTTVAENDSGISSAKKSKRTRDSVESTTAPKISKKSKTAISKNRKSNYTSTVKKLGDINWVKGLLNEGVISHQQKIKAGQIEIRYPSSLTLRKEHDVDYVIFPWYKGNCGGYVRMKPGCEKKIRVAASTMNFVILIGKLQLLAAKHTTEFQSGAIITIPKGVRYGLKNHGKQTTFLRFHSLQE